MAVMTEEERGKLADKISKDIVEILERDPRILGFHRLGWRGTSDLENEIYGFLMDHAIFEASSNAD